MGIIAKTVAFPFWIAVVGMAGVFKWFLTPPANKKQE